MRRTLVCLCLLTACNEPSPAEVPLTQWTEWVAGVAVDEATPKVDVLLVIDDSPSMHDQAPLLAENLRAIARVYEGEQLDYRIGVITTHHSGPDCAAGPDGALVRTSCRERLSSFVASANQESPEVDIRDVCTDSCALEGLDFRPTAVVGQDEVRPRAWVQRGGAGKNTADPVASLTCLGQVGVNGCTAESPLGAVLHFLDRTEDPQDPDFGFVRGDAGLSVVLIGDEDDCSRSSATSLRGEGSLSAACWREAADCSEGESELSCETANSSELLEMDRFIERLMSIDANKRLAQGTDNQRVFVSAVAGVPPGYPDRPQTFETGDDPEFETAFGIGAGCAQGDVIAAPSVRTIDAAEAFEPWQANVVSACASDWSPALACLPGIWGGGAQLPPFCIDIELLGEDADPAESCVLTETTNGETRRLPECTPHCPDGTCGPPELPAGADACVAWRTQETREPCLAEGFGGEVIVVRREPSWDRLEYEVRCAAEI